MNLLTLICYLLYTGYIVGQFQFNINEAPPIESKPIVSMQSQPNPGADTAASSPQKEPPRTEELP